MKYLLLILMLSSCSVSKTTWTREVKVTHVQKTDEGIEVYLKDGRVNLKTIFQRLPDSIQPGKTITFQNFIRIK